MIAWGGDNGGGRCLGLVETFLFLIKLLSFNKDDFRNKWS